MILNTLRHSAFRRENLGSKQSLFDLNNSFRILPLLLVLMFLVALLGSQVSLSVCVG